MTINKNGRTVLFNALLLSKQTQWTGKLLFLYINDNKRSTVPHQVHSVLNQCRWIDQLRFVIAINMELAHPFLERILQRRKLGQSSQCIFLFSISLRDSPATKNKTKQKCLFAYILKQLFFLGLDQLPHYLSNVSQLAQSLVFNCHSCFFLFYLIQAKVFSQFYITSNILTIWPQPT